MTNADKIRSMTDEQLASWLYDKMDCWHCPIYYTCKCEKGCVNVLKAWLQQEAESNDK